MKLYFGAHRPLSVTAVTSLSLTGERGSALEVLHGCSLFGRRSVARLICAMRILLVGVVFALTLLFYFANLKYDALLLHTWRRCPPRADG